MKLTLAITSYNRWELLLESFAQVIDDDRIDEILIMDDCSSPEYWNKIKDLDKFNPKIKVVRQLENRGMSINKRDAVFNSNNEWVILFDSDNVIKSDYVDALMFLGLGFERASETIFCPSFAKPNFDYRKYDGKEIDKHNGPDLVRVGGSTINCFLNTCNYVVNRDKYLSAWKEGEGIIASDTVWFNYLWLQAGYSFYVVPNMHYNHRVHNDSGFLKDCDYNIKKADEIKKLIMEL